MKINQISKNELNYTINNLECENISDEENEYNSVNKSSTIDNEENKNILYDNFKTENVSVQLEQFNIFKKFNYKFLIFFFLLFFLPYSKDTKKPKILKLTQIKQINDLMTNNWLLIIGKFDGHKYDNIAEINMDGLQQISILDVLIGGNWQLLNQYYKEEELIQEGIIIFECENDIPRFVPEKNNNSKSIDDLLFAILQTYFRNFISSILKGSFSNLSANLRINLQLKIENGILLSIRDKKINKIEPKRKIDLINVFDFYFERKIRLLKYRIFEWVYINAKNFFYI